VDPITEPLLFFSGSAGNRTQASGSVAKNSDHYTTEAVSESENSIQRLLKNLNGNVHFGDIGTERIKNIKEMF
jgi:hypothetical protein